jgi:hypothetical protein
MNDNLCPYCGIELADDGLIVLRDDLRRCHIGCVEVERAAGRNVRTLVPDVGRRRRAAAERTAKRTTR